MFFVLKSEWHRWKGMFAMIIYLLYLICYYTFTIYSMHLLHIIYLPIVIFLSSQSDWTLNWFLKVIELLFDFSFTSKYTPQHVNPVTNHSSAETS